MTSQILLWAFTQEKWDFKGTQGTAREHSQGLFFTAAK